MGKRAYDSWRLLSGVICTYKSPETTYKYVLSKLKGNICRDLNNLETRPQRHCLIADRSGGEVSISIKPSYADHVLCAGPRYQTYQIKTGILSPLGELSSGVFLVCINGGYLLTESLKKLSFTKCYHIKGVLGQATTNFHTTGEVLARAQYDKVCKARFENVLASFQSALHRRLFEEHGVQLDSQEAYNLATRGLYRPVWNGPTIVYGINIVDFEPPNFTLEVNCINETEVYLMNLIHNLGVSLKCYATCTGIRCIRQGCFHVEHALVKNQWTLDNITENIKLTWEILEKNYPKKLKYSHSVRTYKPKIEAEQCDADKIKIEG